MVGWVPSLLDLDEEEEEEDDNRGKKRESTLAEKMPEKKKRESTLAEKMPEKKNDEMGLFVDSLMRSQQKRHLALVSGFDYPPSPSPSPSLAPEGSSGSPPFSFPDSLFPSSFPFFSFSLSSQVRFFFCISFCCSILPP